jgi:hypothetical protein
MGLRKGDLGEAMDDIGWDGGMCVCMCVCVYVCVCGKVNWVKLWTTLGGMAVYSLLSHRVMSLI